MLYRPEAAPGPLVNRVLPLAALQRMAPLLKREPYYMTNIADDWADENVRHRVEAKLFAVLEVENDPRLPGTPCSFEAKPYAGSVPKAWFEDWMQ